MKLIIFVVCCLAPTVVWAQSFDSGNELKAVRLTGEFSLRCPQKSRIARCQDDFLLGGSHQLFHFDTQGSEVDRLSLSSVQAKGRNVKKKAKFKWQEGRSKGEINLWIDTLFQRALFDYGENQVHYELTNKKEKVFEGDFLVSVSLHEERTCRYDVLYSNSNSDCNNPSFLCDRYYRRNDYCR